MKFYTEQTLKNLQPQLKTALEKLRQRRNFKVEVYLAAKAGVLNDYMRQFKLKTCVVAVSGGLDSAVTLALVLAASKQANSAIEKIIPVALPVFKSEFTTNQELATTRAQELVGQLGLASYVIDLTKPFMELKNEVDKKLGVTGEAWASGQLVAYVRTPALYYITSLMSQIDKASIICGTINRDEGAYLGYFGKASDGLVDIQLISDLHKSEVRQLGEYFSLPSSILAAAPTGDMFDGRIDEVVFGAPYDFVELLLLLKSLASDWDRDFYMTDWSAEAKEQFEVLSARLEKLHDYNSHKYLGRSPAVHLDVMESGVPGGWPNGYEKVSSEARGKEYFVNAFPLTKEIWPKFYSKEPAIEAGQLALVKGEGYEFKNLLTADERQEILLQADEHGWQPVGIDGIGAHYKPGDKIGSYRASSFSPELAGLLWRRLSAKISSLRVMSAEAQTDWDGHYVWRAIGLSPLFRFIKYVGGGLLVPHYDAPFSYPNGQKTLMSLVVYLKAENITGGQTRFINDPQLRQPSDHKNYADWLRLARDDEVLFSVDPQPGAAILFDHRLLHDSREIAGLGQKIIMRTDLVFVKCGLK